MLDICLTIAKSMVMRWLTRSTDDDAEMASREAAYRAHLQSLLPRLPEPLRGFAGEPVGGRLRSVHDGRVESWHADLPDRFRLQLVCGDLQRGYERLAIEYVTAVELLGPEVTELAEWLADKRTEFLYDEVDALADGRFEHRHLLWPEGEFGVRFFDVAVTATPATPEMYEQARDHQSSG